MTARPILHVLGTAAVEGTGVARVVAAIARHHVGRGHPVHAWFLAGDGPLAAELERAGAAVRVLPWGHRTHDPTGVARLARALVEADPDIVHQHFGGRKVRWVVRAATRARILLHLHTRINEARGGRAGPIPVTGAHRVIAVSRAVAAAAPPGRAEVVYSGVPAGGEPDGHGRTGRLIGAAGRLVPVKGLVHLIRALDRVRARVPGARLEIAGTGPERAPLGDEVRRLGLQDHVRFVGWQPGLEPWLARWDVFAMPSLDEGFALAALEAMRAGLPVVASDAGGLPELVEHGRTGWLVPVGDPGALAGRLQHLLQSPDERRAMGRAGHVRVGERFSLPQMLSRLDAIYGPLWDPA